MNRLPSIEEALTAPQLAAANHALEQESAKRRHLVVSLSGAHAYGFSSPDSDLDLKAIHLEPARNLLSLAWHHQPAERLEMVGGVEIDYSSNELREVLAGVLAGNGNYLERILGHLQFRAAPEMEPLRPLVAASLSQRVHRHYQGFARGQLREWEKGGFRSAKRLLYVLRTTLTGAHVLLAGTIATDLRELLELQPLAGALGREVSELIERKTEGEHAELTEPQSERWRESIARAFACLDDARARSPLPEEPRNAAELDAWQLELRRATW